MSLENEVKNEAKEVILLSHQGIGDIFSCVGMVNYLAEKYKGCFYIVREDAYDMTLLLYRDNQKISVIPIRADVYAGKEDNYIINDLREKKYVKDNKYEVLRNGMAFNMTNWGKGKHFVDAFYLQFEMDPIIRINYFNYNKKTPFK